MPCVNADELAAVGIDAFGGPHDNDKRCSFSEEMTHDKQVLTGINVYT